MIYLEDGFASVREAGGEPDPAALDLYGRLADRQRRLADPLGWRRAQKEVSWRDKWFTEGDATHNEEQRAGEVRHRDCGASYERR